MSVVLLGLLLLPGQQPAAAKGLEQAVDAYLKTALKDRSFSGVILVSQKGQPLLHKAYGHADWTNKTPSTPGGRFMIFSVSKHFTAAAVLRLRQAGQLSLDHPVSKHIEHWPKEWQAVTLHHLLSHSSSIDVDTLYFWLIKHHPRFWDEKAGTPPSYVAKPLLDKPGTTFRYSNAGYTVLTLVIEKMAGEVYPSALRKLVFEPLGLKDTAIHDGTVNRARGHQWTTKGPVITEQQTHYVTGAGDVVSTAADLLRWDEALYGTDFLTAESKRAMWTGYTKVRLGRMGYSWVVQGEEQMFFTGAGSGFAALYARRPAERLCIVMLSNVENDDARAFNEGLIETVVKSLKK